jgi:hypothetical protein
MLNTDVLRGNKNSCIDMPEHTSRPIHGRMNEAFKSAYFANFSFPMLLPHLFTHFIYLSTYLFIFGSACPRKAVKIPGFK